MTPPSNSSPDAALQKDICFEVSGLPKTAAEVPAFNHRELKDMKQSGNRPREIHLQVSKRCNLECAMCSWQTWTSNVGQMEMALFERILAECKAAEVRKIVFGNAQGEPFLHPHIIEMLERAVTEGFWVMVSTNGTPLTPARIEKLALMGLHHIQFSFAGYSKETYERVYVGANWEKVSRNLKMLASALARARARTSLLINGCYAETLSELVQPNAFIARTKAFLHSLGIAAPKHQINIQLPHNFAGNIPTGHPSEEPIDSNFNIPSWRPGLCRVLRHAPGIYHDGKVTACGCLDPNGDLQIGDITQQGLMEIRTGSEFQRILDTFINGDLQTLPLCAHCDIPYFERPDRSPRYWARLLDEVPDTDIEPLLAKTLLARYDQALASVMRLAAARLGPGPADEAAYVARMCEEVKKVASAKVEPAYAISYRLFRHFGDDRIIETVAGRPVRRIGLAPATKAVLENLDWFQKRFDEVVVGDNFKVGQSHFGQTVLSLDALLAKADEIDFFLLTTNTAEIEADYLSILPMEKTLSISQLSPPMHEHHFARYGRARAQRILAEIEAAENPIVVLGNKLLATAEPTFVALELAGYDVFVVSLYDKMENQERSGHDGSCAVMRNALVSPLEQLYILTHLQKGLFWIYYDFFCNVGWDAVRSMATYASAATIMALASRPVVMGMYDIIKPICLNMDRSHEAFALYKTMMDHADAVALTSKSDHIAEYLRNTLVKDRPVISFYRYSFPPSEPLPRLSERDGERHLVGVTSFLGEVYEPNRIETRNSIRSILRQKIHFHYYSDHQAVKDFYSSLPPEEQVYFHRETAIWDQAELVREMSRYDGGWLVGDEATIFARLISSVEDRHIRELFTLFVPNGVPTSSMTYGAAGLAVFISRQIKVMDEVYPRGCCIPLDMGEVDNLARIFQRLDWQKMHQEMRDQSQMFDIFHQIPRLVAFLDEVKAQESHRTK